MPSFASSDPNSAGEAPGLRGQALVQVAVRRALLDLAIASGACPASFRAQASAVSNSSWSGTTWFASPC